MSKKVNILWIWSELIAQLETLLIRLKLEESKIANRQNAIENAAAQVSVAT